MSNPRIKWGSDNLPTFPAITRDHYVETPETVIDYMLHLERTVADLARINAAFRLLVRWYDWAWAHGYLGQAEGIARQTRELIKHMEDK